MFILRNRHARWQKWLVSHVYATHNSSPLIKRALNYCLKDFSADQIGLNVGAGSSGIHQSILNLDIVPGATIDCCAKAEYLPFFNESFSVVISQETLEHVQDPFLSMQEMARVLKPKGLLYCQLPFVIGYHPGPTDFWRFSKEGIRQIVENTNLQCKEVGIAVGPATGFYRILVEFIAVLLSSIHQSMYYPAKGASSIVFWPLKLLDEFMLVSDQSDRVAGGYYVIAQKEN